MFYTYNIYNQHFKYKTALKKVCKTFLILFFNIIFIKFAESKNKKVIANKISKAWQQKLYTKFLEAMSMTTKQSEERSNVIRI